MANNVIVQVLGGARQIVDGVSTIADVKRRVNGQSYAASINGDPAKDCDAVCEGNFVTLSQAVKGGQG